MSERFLSAALTVKSAMKQYHNKAQLVPMTKELLGLARVACSSYKAYLEKQRELKVALERNQKE